MAEAEAEAEAEAVAEAKDEAEADPLSVEAEAEPPLVNVVVEAEAVAPILPALMDALLLRMSSSMEESSNWHARRRTVSPFLFRIVLSVFP